MANQVTWTKPQRKLAKETQKVLFACGVDGREVKNGHTGAYIQTGLMDEDKARILFFFSGALYRGLSPQASLETALASVNPDGPTEKT